MANKKSRKAVVTTAAAIMAASAVTPVAAFAAETSFSDVPSNAYYADAVKTLVSKGVLSGYPDGTFKPTQNVKRAEAAKILTVARGWNTNATKSYPDVAASHWAYGYIAAASNAGAFGGDENGNFNPEANLTRAQAAKIIVEAYGLTGSSDLSFKDAANIQSWAVSYIKTAVANGILKGDDNGNVNPNASITRADFAVMIQRAEDATAAPKVVSVSAINAKELVVKFNKAVDPSTVFADPDADTTVLKNGVFYQNDTPLNGAEATLSEDGKSLTITAADNWEGTYLFKVAKESVKTLDGKYIAEYAEKVSYSDNTAPSILGVEKVNSGKYKLNFSEPVKSIGSVTAKLADGSTVPTGLNFTPGNNYAYVTLASDPGVAVTYTFVGTLDYADNLITPNPSTITLVKGDKDGVKPEIKSVTPINSKKFEIQLSEEVMTGSTDDDVNFTKDDISVTGTTVNSLTQDKTDKTKFVVEVNDNLNGKLVTVSVAADKFQDLTGETNKAFSKVVEFKEDTVKPSLSSATVSKDSDGNEVLTLTFSEDVTLPTTGTASYNADKVKDYVTTRGVKLNFDYSDLKAVDGSSNKYQILLSKIKEGTDPLEEGATYTVDLPESVAADNAGLTNDAKTAAFTFTRGKDTNSVTSNIVKDYDSSQATVGGTPASNFVANNGILVVDNDTFQVQFDNTVDGASATNPSNYKVAGATVKSATLLPGNIVEVKLNKNSNTFTGLRTVTISGVKSSTGEVMSEYSTIEYFNENVHETVTGVSVDKITDDANGDGNAIDPETTITLKFSDNLADPGANDDFELYVNGAKVTATVTTANVSGNVVTVKIDKALTSDDFNKGAELRAASTLDIADAVGNVIDFSKATLTLK